MAYPNAADPLNGDAAHLHMNKPDEFRTKCRGIGIGGIDYRV